HTAQDTALRMNPHTEEVAKEGIHAVVNHEDWTVDGIKNSEVKYSSQKAGVFAELASPAFKLPGPLVFVDIKGVTSLKNEFQLVVSVVLVAEDSHERKIELMEVPAVGLIMFLNLARHLIHNTHGIRLHQIFNLHEIHKVLQQR